MEFIQYSAKDRIGYITLHRPERRNALNFEMVSELKAVFFEAESDKNVKVIVLKAQGQTFCAGADLAYLQKMQSFSFEENLEDSRHLANLFYQIYSLKKIVIAQVQGHAFAGGCALASMCDFVYAVPEAKFGFTEVKIGFVPAIVMVFLMRKIGELKTKHLLLTGELVSREKAVAAGLVNQIVSREEIEHAVSEFAHRLITNNSTQSMELIKKMTAEVQSLSFEKALEYVTTMNATVRGGEDYKKGMQSFLDKKDLVW